MCRIHSYFKWSYSIVVHCPMHTIGKFPITIDCLIQALVRIAILLYLIPFKWCEYKTPCSPLKKHGANRRHGVLNRKKTILISLAWCTFFKNTGGNIKQNFDMLYQFQKKWCEYKAWCSFSKINGAIKRHDVLFQKILVWIGWHDVLFKICLIRAPVLQLGRREYSFLKSWQ